MELFLYVLVFGIAVCSAQVAERITRNPCVSKETCGDCIRANPKCFWCTQKDFTVNGRGRCDYGGNLKGDCVEEDIVVPGQGITKMKDLDLSNKGVKEGEAIQIKPQEIDLKLRPNTPYPLVVQFRQAEDYPVDLYYLMDLSNTMRDDKNKLAELGNLLSEKMGNITSNFRLGFGSFIDKVAVPFQITDPEAFRKHSPNNTEPYGFKNHMPLDSKTGRFAEEVRRAQISANLDAPKGGFDALMQAIVCEKEIGWRKKSRKIVVFSSDGGFHYAGDGKLAGIVKPNDGLCHLDNNGFYTKSDQQDYPSLGQINTKLQEHNINLIFAVTADQVPVYDRLSELLEGSSAGRLENDSSNVVGLVQEQYDKITSAVELKDNAGKHVQVTYYSSCLGDKRKKTNICKGLKVGTNVMFEANIEVLSCPEDPKEWNQTFQIYPVGLNEALTVNLEMICECNCEKPWNIERNSQKCSFGNGTYECGVCSCYNNRQGRECECDVKDGDQDINDANCFFGNDRKPCSGRGVCRCGECECFKRKYRDEMISGKFCECDNYSCDRSDGLICSGPDHGVCDCGYCKCKPGWTGTDCACQITNESCMAPNGELCSGKGHCVCGQCRCQERYTGPVCDWCPTCPTKCDAFRQCVECQVFPFDSTVPPKDCWSCSFISIVVDKFQVNEEENEKLCVFRDDKGCRFTFKYKLDETFSPMVHVQRTKDCPQPISIAKESRRKKKYSFHRNNVNPSIAASLGDRYKWGENPIYLQATTTFSNPTFSEEH